MAGSRQRIEAADKQAAGTVAAEASGDADALAAAQKALHLWSIEQSWCHFWGCPIDSPNAARVLRRGINLLGQTEVRQPNLAREIDEHILRLQIPSGTRTNQMWVTREDRSK